MKNCVMQRQTGMEPAKRLLICSQIDPMIEVVFFPPY